MNNTPKANLPHIAFVGNRNVGKSSLINKIVSQQLSIVSEVAGTTTDPVEKNYELQPVGPVVFIDTAGIDDLGELGEKRVFKTEEVLKRTDIAVFVFSAKELANNFSIVKELEMVSKLKTAKRQIMVVLNKVDLVPEATASDLVVLLAKEFGTPVVSCSAELSQGIEVVKEKLVNLIELLAPEPAILADLVAAPDSVVLVVPIDKEAPKGRLILPQVQTIRELLDMDVACTVVKEKELHYTLTNVLKQKPKLVVTDSQVFQEVAAVVPEDILLTSFSVLFARQKGDLETYLRGVKKIAELKDGDHVLIAESCSHRPISEDIGRVKIPRWLEQYTDAKLEFTVFSGKDFPADLSKYSLVIQCGGCMVNRALILSRISEVNQQEVAITNYGIAIAFLKGILPRALKPFPAISDKFNEA